MTGQLRDLAKTLAQAEQLAAELAEQISRARAAYDVDESDLLASGAYTKELLAAAAEAGLSVFEEDGRLLCYPSLIRILPGEASIEIDRRKERWIRPSVVVERLASAQQAGPRFKAEPFLASLAAAYDLVVAKQGKDGGAIVKLEDVYRVLTLLPGQTGVRPRSVPSRPQRVHRPHRPNDALGGQHRHQAGRRAHHGRSIGTAATVLGNRVPVTQTRGSGLPLGGTGLTCQDYLDFVTAEYLATYIRAGGAAVRFIVGGNDDVTRRWHAGLADAAGSQECLYVALDAAETKMAMIDQISPPSPAMSTGTTSYAGRSALPGPTSACRPTRG